MGTTLATIWRMPLTVACLLLGGCASNPERIAAKDNARLECGRETIRIRDEHPWITDNGAGALTQRCMADRGFSSVR